MFALVLFLSFIIIIFFFFFFPSNVRKLEKKSIQRPPSPPALPIIGHLHLLGPSLAKRCKALAAGYGPIMRLQLVSTSSIIVSNAAIAREIMKDNEMSISARPEFGCSGYNIYDGCSFMFAEYGKYWRFMRKVCVSQLLSAAQIKCFGDIRREEMMKLLENLVKCSEEGQACDMGEEFARMINNITCRVVMSTRCEDESMMIRKLVKEVEDIMTKYGVGELFGPLGKIGFSHYGRKFKSLLSQFDAMVEKKMVEHLKGVHSFRKMERKDIMDLLLEVFRDENAEMKLSKQHIKNFLLVG